MSRIVTVRRSVDALKNWWRDWSQTVAVGSITWGQEFAEAYDAIYAYEAEPSVLDPMVALLAEQARGPLPLSRRRYGPGRAGAHRARGACDRDRALPSYDRAAPCQAPC